jgi:hypothetical protein
MKTTYLKLDLEAIRRDFPEVWANFENEFEITPTIGNTVSRNDLKPGQYVIAGSSEFHFLLTKR